MLSISLFAKRRSFAQSQIGCNAKTPTVPDGEGSGAETMDTVSGTTIGPGDLNQSRGQLGTDNRFLGPP